jgi:hypothetical protein
MLDRNKPVQTRDGRKVTIYTWDAPSDYPIVGLTEGSRFPDSWRVDGSYHNRDIPSEKDLINVPEQPKKHKVKLYFREDKGMESGVWASPYKGNTNEKVVAIKEIEFTEGEGL